MKLLDAIWILFPWLVIAFVGAYEWRVRRADRLLTERWRRDPEKFMREFPGPEL